MLSIKLPFELFGTDFVADIEVEITTRSYAGRQPSLSQPGEPPEGCEWNIRNCIIIHQDKDTKILSAPDWIFKIISECDELAEAVAEAEADEPRGRAARDPDEAYDSRFE